MELYNLKEQIEYLVDHLEKRETFDYSDLRIVVSPYRISPLGAHIDHQGGPVLGMAINARSILVYVPNREGKIRLYSANYPGIVEFNLDNIKTPKKDDWGRYAMGAAKVIGERKKINTGFTGVVLGTLPASGLSSSASVGLAYIKALANVNGFEFNDKEFIYLDSLIENEFLKLQNGILDQCSIVYGKIGNMTYIDTISGDAAAHPMPESAEDFKLLILFTGLTHQLTSSGFNQRVEACDKTAMLLGTMGGIKSAAIFSDIPKEKYLENEKRLPADLKPWAKHYFSEVHRVEAGIKEWDAGNWEAFGHLMNQSSISTIENYDKGSLEAKRLFEITASQSGVYGAAVNGGGYGGCVVAFVKNDFSENSAYEIMTKYKKDFPVLEEKAEVFFAESDQGLRILS